MISQLPTTALLESTALLAARERALTLEVVAHLREILRRRAYVDAGYSSLWEYCTLALKYSAGAAKRRIDALRALSDHPDLEASVAEGALSLSTLSQVQSFVRQQDVSHAESHALFIAMAGKSSRDVELALATIAPESARPDRVRAVSETHVRMEVTIPRELLAELDRLRSLLAHQVGTYGELLQVLARTAAKELDPARAPRRQGAPRSAPSKRASGSGARASTPSTRGTRNESVRYIPAALKREIWRRDRGRCVKCGSSHALQIDHVRPFAAGGLTTARNLRLLCRQHNLHRSPRGPRNPRKSPC